MSDVFWLLYFTDEAVCLRQFLVNVKQMGTLVVGASKAGWERKGVNKDSIFLEKPPNNRETYLVRGYEHIKSTYGLPLLS